MSAKEFICTVQSSRHLTTTVFELILSFKEPIAFKAGQYIKIIFPEIEGHGRHVQRAYSIASPPQENTIELCLKMRPGDPFSAFLHNLKIGDTLECVGPSGELIYHPKEKCHFYFISTGTGIAPLKSIILSKGWDELESFNITCLHGILSENEIFYHEQLSKIKKLEIVPVIEHPSENWKGYHGRVTDYLRLNQNNIAWMETEFYLCGYQEMIDEAFHILIEHGTHADSIHTETFSRKHLVIT